MSERSTSLNRKGYPKQSPLVDGMNERKLRQLDAAVRQSVRALRSDSAQLLELDLRLGANVGAARERKRLGKARGAA